MSETTEDRRLLGEVARQIGKGWRLSERQTYPYLLEWDLGEHELCIRRKQAGGKQRFEISAHTPGEYEFSEAEQAQGLRNRHEISVSAESSARHIAGQISRRLLPGYQKSVSAVIAVRMGRRERQLQRERLIERLVDAGRDIGAEATGNPETGDLTGASIPVRDNSTPVSGTFTPVSDQVTHVSLANVPADVAVEILELIADARDAEA